MSIIVITLAAGVAVVAIVEGWVSASERRQRRKLEAYRDRLPPGRVPPKIYRQ